MTPPDRAREALLQRVVARAADDEVFRRRLLTDPETALRDGFGAVFPPGHRIRFIEKPSGVDTLIVLPDPNHPDDELDEDDLDAVAGGTDEPTKDTW